MPERYRPLWNLIRRLTLPWGLLGVVCLFMLTETLLGLWVPLLTRDLIESASGGSIPRALIGRLVGVILVEAVFSACSLYLLARAGEQVTAFLRGKLVRRLVRLPMRFHDEQQSGELVSRTLSDTASVQSLLTDHLVAMVAGVFSMVGAVVILWFLDWRLTLVLFLSALAAVLMVVPVAARLQGIGKETQDQLAEFSGRLAGVLGDMRLLKASCAEDAEAERASTRIEALRILGLRQARILAVLGPTVTLGMSGALVLILSYGGARVASGALTVGTLVAFILYLFQVVMPMVQFSAFIAELNTAAGAAEHLSSLLEEPEEDRVEGGREPDTVDAIRFCDVTHAYGEGDAVLENLDLEIPAGKVTALVGPSGGGKTTVLSLVERFYEPRSGEVTVRARGADVPLGDLALESWRRRIGYVTQEAPLLWGTVRENLCYGLEWQPTDEEIHACAAGRLGGRLRGRPRRRVSTPTSVSAA